MQNSWFYEVELIVTKGDTEMQKVASVASVASALVLFFPPTVLIFGLYTRKTC